MVIESHNFKTLPSLIHRYQNQNLKILLSLLWLSHFTISKFYQPSTRNFFWNGNFSYFNFIIFEERQNVSIIITVVGNNTALVSYVFFGYLRPMSHDVNKKALPRAPSPPKFPSGLFVILQQILYQPSFVLIRLLQKIMHFQTKTIFFF